MRGGATDCSLRCAQVQKTPCNLDDVVQLVRREGGSPTSRGASRGLFNVNARASDDSTVLHWSVAQGRVELTATIAKLPGIDLDARDKQGRTPLHLAALQAHESPDHLQCLFLLVELGGVELAGVPDDDGATALHVAAEKGALQTARILIHTGVKVDCANHDGMTPLQLAARSGQAGVVQALLQAGASLRHVDFDGHAALAHASAAGHLDVVSLLLGAGADASASDLLSASPLKLAIGHAHLDVSNLLIRSEEAVDLRACGVHQPEWLLSLCTNAQAAMSINLSSNSIGDEGAAGVLSAAAVSLTKLVVLDLSKNNIKGSAMGMLAPEVLLGLSRLSSLSLAQNLLVDFACQARFLSHVVLVHCQL
jgi:ankyrin repeat protein